MNLQQNSIKNESQKRIAKKTHFWNAWNILHNEPSYWKKCVIQLIHQKQINTFLLKQIARWVGKPSSYSYVYSFWIFF